MSDQQGQLINKYKIDMATVIRTIPEYKGETDDDVEKWLAESLLVAEVAELTEIDTLKVLTLSLKGETRLWVTHYRRLNNECMNLKKFIEALTERF
jgi:hypothetical protein